MEEFWDIVFILFLLCASLFFGSCMTHCGWKAGGAFVDVIEGG